MSEIGGKPKSLRIIKEYVLIAVGILLYALGWQIFMIPNGIVGGGVTGISSIAKYVFGIPISYTYFILNFILLLIGVKVLGKGFGFKTVYAALLATLFFYILPMILPEDGTIVKMFAKDNGLLLSVICAGALAGFGIGITFGQGGSSGGTDIIALSVSKKYNISPGKMTLYMDIIIIGCSIFIPNPDLTWGQKLANVMYGYIMDAVFTSALDLYLSGMKQSMQIFIFSKDYEKIAERISTEAHRGVTILNGRGWYSKKESQILLVIVRKSELSHIFRITKETDSEAFLSVGSVTGVYGQGFDRFKK